jgi:galactokinase
MSLSNPFCMDDFFVYYRAEDVGEPKSFEVDISKEITPIESPKWANYVLGVLALFLQRIQSDNRKSFRLFIATSVPIGGLSSSASVEVAMCTFLQLLYEGSTPNFEPLSKVDKALLCCKAERTFANVPCGIMDQYTACMAEAQHALLVDCQNNTSKLIPMKDKNVCVLVTNSNVKHALVAGAYAERVKNCQEAAKILGNAEFFVMIDRHLLVKKMSSFYQV